MAGIPPRGVYYAVVLFLVTMLVFWGQFGCTCLGKGERKSSVVRRAVKIKIFSLLWLLWVGGDVTMY